MRGALSRFGHAPRPTSVLPFNSNIDEETKDALVAELGLALPKPPVVPKRKRLSTMLEAMEQGFQTVLFPKKVKTIDDYPPLAGGHCLELMRKLCNEGVDRIRIQDLLRKYDADDSGTMEEPEFKMLVLEMLQKTERAGFPEREEDLTALFQEFDDDGSGIISHKELTKKLRPISTLRNTFATAAWGGTLAPADATPTAASEGSCELTPVLPM